MSGGFRYSGDPTRMTRDAFCDWLKASLPSSVEDYIKINGKPRVRVPVERQTPNEADL